MVGFDPEGVVAPPRGVLPSPIGAGGESHPKGSGPVPAPEGTIMPNSAADRSNINAPVRLKLDLKHKRIHHTGCRFLNKNKKGKKFLGGEIIWKKTFKSRELDGYVDSIGIS